MPADAKHKKYNDSLKGRYRSVKSRAKISSRAFELSLEEFSKIINRGCLYCLTVEAVGLDRIDNDRGYEKDNVLPCCGECNRIRSNMYTVDEMIAIGKTIIKIKRARRK